MTVRAYVSRVAKHQILSRKIFIILITMNTLPILETSRPFVSAVLDPFGADAPAFVPDLLHNNSICLTDTYETVPISAAAGAAACDTVLIFMRTGYSKFYNDQTQTNPDMLYTLSVLMLDSSGNVDNYYNFELTNYQTIFNSVDGIPTATALVAAYRIFAMGLRVLPSVEIVTNSAAPYVLYYIGGQFKLDDLEAALEQNSSVITLVRNSPYSDMFANNEGCTARYNPFQLETQLSLHDSTATMVNTGCLEMPCVLVKFSQAIDSGGLFPIRVDCRVWLEGILKQPTPIYSTSSTPDPYYPQLRAILSASSDTLPLVTKGHTFEGIDDAVQDLVGIAGRLFGYALKIGAQKGKSYARRGKRAIVRKAKKKFRNSRKGGRDSGRVPSGVLGPTKPRQPPNVSGRFRRKLKRRNRN